ncbi:16S rRNA (cytidine(1402)-2'-O)-methyltransferase [Rhodobacterales bacterium HKCCE2091]|nr:16S rRNA (cytidine(1402)-2'-O)-methyltransferase [Rhodobacterales bacterium HKCCE2091]
MRKSSRERGAADSSPAARAEPGLAPTLAPGLYLVSTPIGAARDITLRALDVLRTADALAAEDTRTARKLMEIHGIPLGDRPLLAYHDHNGPGARPKLLGLLAQGAALAYASEAGTPLVADPGYRLAQEAIAAGHAVHAVPGPSAVLAALAVSGLPSDRFLFAGFPPGKGARLETWLEQQAASEATLILYESPLRVHELLGFLVRVFGEETRAALCRELTKRHEEVIRGTLADIASAIDGRTLKGEVVMVIGPRAAVAPDEAAVEAALRGALGRLRVKDAAAEVAERFGLPRRQVYQMALDMGRDGGTDGDGT